MFEREMAVEYAPDELLRAILGSCSEGVVLLDSEGRILEWSAGARRLYGYTSEEILGTPISHLHPKLERPLEPSPPGIPFDAERGESTLLRRRNGETGMASIVIRPIRRASSTGAGALLLVRDLTQEKPEPDGTAAREHALADALRALRRSHEELKTTQIQLMHSAKLESVGRLAAGVAHEVKNPLAIILAATQLLRQYLPEGDGVAAETLQDIEDATRRANRIILGLLDFAAANELSMEQVDLHQVITATLQLAQHAVSRNHIEVVRDADGAIPPLSLDRMKIEQVLLNLIINAVDSMPEGGTLTIRKRLTQLRMRGPDVGYRATDPLRVGQTVAVIEIEDTGPGIPPEKLDRVFDPFFTTKPPGKGTGLGLAMCRTIVGLHGGSVRLENRPEGGARATVILRASTQEREVAP
jgi:PAS domain S-box-containing protein